MDPGTLELVGAFVSGAGAVATGIFSMRLIQRRDRADCAERIEEERRAFREGFQLGGGK